MEQNTNRIVWLDIMKAFSIMAVVLNHTHLPHDTNIALICHIPLLFFETIAGCFVLWIGTFIISIPFIYVINRFCPILAGKKTAF